MSNPTQYDAVLGGNSSSPSKASASAVMGVTNRYKYPDHKQFCLDMIRAQIPIKHYEGRFYWSGPGAEVPDIQDVLSYTKVKCLWDEMGKNKWIVYPRSYSQESIREVEELLSQTNQFPIHSRIDYGTSESYKRQFDALIEMMEVEFNLRLVK